MALPVSVLPAGVTAALEPATAKVTINTRVTAAAGPVGVIADVMQFPGPLPPVIGNWAVGATRVFVMALPVIHQASTGASFGPPPLFVPTGPMFVTRGDAHVMAM
jgi:hypothetical protein